MFLGEVLVCPPTLKQFVLQRFEVFVKMRGNIVWQCSVPVVLWLQLKSCL